MQGKNIALTWQSFQIWSILKVVINDNKMQFHRKHKCLYMFSSKQRNLNFYILSKNYIITLSKHESVIISAAVNRIISLVAKMLGNLFKKTLKLSHMLNMHQIEPYMFDIGIFSMINHHDNLIFRVDNDLPQILSVYLDTLSMNSKKSLFT